MSVAVLVSGSGTNMTAIVEEQRRIEKKGGEHYGRIDCVFTNVPGCEGAVKAVQWGIPVVSISSKRFFGLLGKSPDDEQARDYYDAAAFSLIEGVCTPDLIVLAGYRRRLGEQIHRQYSNRIVNLYPGDTTKDYLVRGVDASVQALRKGEDSIRATVFFGRYEIRFGPALVQSKPVSLAGFTEDDAADMAEKIRREAEWVIYPFAVHGLIAKGRVAVDEEDFVRVDGVSMGKGGYRF
ncbi:MAG: formyltransferase family protein [Thermodesulfobacteriota bacterium]